MKTWGCAHNNSDSEYMAGMLAANGYKLTENKFDADLWLLNSCTVKSPSEDHFKLVVFNSDKFYMLLEIFYPTETVLFWFRPPKIEFQSNPIPIQF